MVFVFLVIVLNLTSDITDDTFYYRFQVPGWSGIGPSTRGTVLVRVQCVLKKSFLSPPPRFQMWQANVYLCVSSFSLFLVFPSFFGPEPKHDDINKPNLKTIKQRPKHS